MSAYISPSKVFRHLDRLAGWQRGGKPAPVTIEWDLSNRCVLGCQGCHFAHTHTRGPWVSRDRRLPMAFESSGDLADLKTVRRALGQMAAANVRGIVWTGGGEPTTHPQWVDCVEEAAERGLEQGMYTLGGLLTPQTAATLGRWARWVVVSLDCLDAETYTAEKGVPPARFEAACNGIRWLVEAQRATVGVSFLLHAGNWRQMPEMLSLARSLGASYTTFRPTIAEAADQATLAQEDRSWIDESLPLLRAMALEPDVECDPPRYEAYRDWQGRSYAVCHGIKLSATVTPDGRVWVCPQRRGMSGSSIGDLTRESFSAIWARHPGQWTDFRECRVMCRLHLVNSVLHEVFAPRRHEAFV